MGDIDVLITKKTGEIKGLLQILIESLEKDGFLKERLGDLRYSQGGSEGYMGIC